MRLFNLKKTISYSTAFLTIFSSMSILNCAKVNATQEKLDSKSKYAYNINDTIKFTQGDLDNLIMRPQPANGIPNLANLLKKDRNINHWIRAMGIYSQITTDIELLVPSQNYKGLEQDITRADISEICEIESINIGNLLNEIRDILTEDGIPQEIKKEKYLRLIIDFLNSTFRGIRLIKKSLKPRFEKFESIKTNLLQLLKQTSGEEDISKVIENIEEIRKNNPEEEINVMAKIIQNVIISKRNLYLIRVDASYWTNKKIPLYEKIQSLKSRTETGQKLTPDEAKNRNSLIDECTKIMEKEIEVAKCEALADYELLKATEDKYIIEDIPRAMLLNEIEKLNF